MSVVRTIVAVDLGKDQDHAAIGAIERTHRELDVLRFLERPPLKTAYTILARRIIAVATNPLLGDDVDMVIDATGLGSPVVDVIREELFGEHTLAMSVDAAREVAQREKRRVLPRLVPIVIGSGLHPTVDALGYQHVPKSVLVSAMQVAVQNETIKAAEGLAHAKQLEGELRAFREKMTKAGNRQYAAEKERDHDDLVMMLIIGEWWSRRFPRPAPLDPDGLAENEAERLKSAFMARLQREKARANRDDRRQPHKVRARGLR